MVFTYCLVLLFGLVIGSFLNVVIFRYDNNLSLKSLMGRSSCLTCNKKLLWYELIPVFSFLVQRGKCRGCSSKISWQYPIVEILTGFVFLSVYFFETNLRSEFTYLYTINYMLYAPIIYYWIIFSVLIVITIYDIKHKIIPDSLSFLFSGLALLPMLINFQSIGLWDWLAGPVVALPFALLWLFSQGKWMGFGDAKLALGIGWFMGLVNGFSSIILAFWIGGVFGLFLIVLSRLGSLSFIKKNFTIKSEVPFAPFLVLGMVLIFFFGWDILGISNF